MFIQYLLLMPPDDIKGRGGCAVCMRTLHAFAKNGLP